MRAEFARPLDNGSRPCRPGQLRPSGPRTGALCFTARQARSVPGIPRLARPARKGGCGDLQDARTRNDTPYSFAP
jgi:hypothetical protein